MSLFRAEIDRTLLEVLAESGIKNHHVGWGLNPAELHVLVNGELKRERISTRMTRRELRALCKKIEMWGRMGPQWDGRAGIKATDTRDYAEEEA
jgi:hypothetical protein